MLWNIRIIVDDDDDERSLTCLISISVSCRFARQQLFQPAEPFVSHLQTGVPAQPDLPQSGGQAVPPLQCPPAPANPAQVNLLIGLQIIPDAAF